MSYTIYDILTQLEQLEEKEGYLAYLRQLRSAAAFEATPRAIVMANIKPSESETVARAVSFGDD